MKCFAILALVTLASASSIEWAVKSREGNGFSTEPQNILSQVAEEIRQRQFQNRLLRPQDVLTGLGRFGRQSNIQPFPMQQLTSGWRGIGSKMGQQMDVSNQYDQLVEQLDQAQLQNLFEQEQDGGFRNIPAVAQKLARQIIQQIKQIKQTKILEAIQELKQQYRQQEFVPEGQLIKKVQNEGITEAIQQLEQMMEDDEQQQFTGKNKDNDNMLEQTLQALIEADMTCRAVKSQEGGKITQFDGRDSRVFKTMIEKLIIQHVMQKIQRVSAEQQEIMLQLEQQQLMLKQKQHKMKEQITKTEEQGMQPQLVQQLKQAKQQLVQQERELAQQQVGTALVGQLMQTAMVKKQQLLQKLSVMEQVNEEWNDFPMEQSRRLLF